MEEWTIRDNSSLVHRVLVNPGNEVDEKYLIQLLRRLANYEPYIPPVQIEVKTVQ